MHCCIRAEHWCTEPVCTACEPVEFREALEDFKGGDRSRLASALATMDLADWFDVPNAQGAMRMTFGALDGLEHVTPRVATPQVSAAGSLTIREWRSACHESVWEETVEEKVRHAAQDSPSRRPAR